MNTIIVLFLLACLTIVNGEGFSWIPGVNVTATENVNPAQLSYKDTYSGFWPIVPTFYGWITSWAADFTENSVDLGAWWRVAHGGPLQFIGAWMGSFTASVTKNSGVQPSTKVGGEEFFHSMNMTLAKSWMYYFFYGFYEVDPEGNTVNLVKFNECDWGLELLNNSTAADDKNGLYWITYTGWYPNKFSPKYEISIQFVASNKAGVLSKLSTPMSPNGLESFWEMKKGFNVSNTPHLIMVTCSADARWDAERNILVSGSNDDDSAYFSVAGQAQGVDADGNTKTVTVSVTEDEFSLETLENKGSEEVRKIIDQRFKGSAPACRKIDVQFEKGYKSLTLDPSVSVGAPTLLQSTSGASSTIIPMMFLTLLLFIVVLV